MGFVCGNGCGIRRDRANLTCVPGSAGPSRTEAVTFLVCRVTAMVCPVEGGGGGEYKFTKWYFI